MLPAGEFFASLTRGVRQAITFLRAAASTEKTVDAILEAARDSGYAFRTQQARDVVQFFRGNIINQDAPLRQARILGEDAVLHPSSYNVHLGRQASNFRYIVNLVTVNRETGETDHKPITVTSNQPRSLREIKDAAMELSTREKYGTQEGNEVTDIQFVEALRSESYEV